MAKVKVELPAQILYFINQIETSKNQQHKYEYFQKLKEVHIEIGKVLDKHKGEFLNP